MANAAIAHRNLIDLTGTVLSSSGSILMAPVTTLQNPHVGKKWRDNATSTYVLAAFPSAQPIDTIMLAGVSGNSPSFHVRLSSVDATGAAGDMHDSPSITGVPYFDSDYGMFVYLLPSPVNAKYLRIDIAESGVDYIEAGRWFAGAMNRFSINFQTPWVRSAVRASVDTLGVGGQTYIDLRRGFWQTSATFEFLEESEAFGFVEDINVAIVNNGHLDVLWIRDPDSPNLSRDCIWGYPTSDLQVSQNIYIIPPLYKVDVALRQRL